MDTDASDVAIGAVLLQEKKQEEKEVKKEDRPNVLLVFFSFRIMVGIGLLMLVTALTGLYLLIKGKLYQKDWYFKLLYFVAPLGFVATVTGWYVTEIGRQPWVVHNLVRTADVASKLPASSVLFSFSLFILVYSTLTVSFVYYYLKTTKKGPDEIMAIRNFGQKSLDELIDRLEEKGYLEGVDESVIAAARSGGLA